MRVPDRLPVEPLEVPFQCGGDAAVAVTLTVPAPPLGDDLERVDVGELVGAGRDELHGGGVVVAGLAEALLRSLYPGHGRLGP